MSSDAGTNWAALALALIGALVVISSFIMGHRISQQRPFKPLPSLRRNRAGSSSSRKPYRSGVQPTHPDWGTRLGANELAYGDGSPLSVPTWFVSGQREAYLRRSPICLVSAVGWTLVSLGAAVEIVGHRASPARGWGGLIAIPWAVAGFGALLAVLSYNPYFTAREAYRQWRLALAAARVDDALTRACEPADGSEPLRLAQLFQLNRRQLDEYQLITRKQQRIAIFCAQAASMVAFAVLIAGILIALNADTDVEKWVTGGLSALGSTLSTFIATTFFRSAAAANQQMNLYYREPQRTGRLLATERLLMEFNGKQGTEERIKSIVEAVMSWEDERQHGGYTDSSKSASPRTS